MKLITLFILVCMSLFLIVFEKEADGFVLACGIIFFIPLVHEMKLFIKRL